MQDLSELAGLGSVILIIPLMIIIKSYVTDKRLWPILAILLGIGINAIVAVNRQTDLTFAVFIGVIAGLSASGLWSGTKAVRGQ